MCPCTFSYYLSGYRRGMTSRPERRWNSRLDMCKTKEKSDEVMRRISVLNHVLLQGLRKEAFH